MLAPPDVVRVAAAQYPLDPLATFADWQAKIARWVAEGALTGADLLVFPEYGLIEVAHAAGPETAQDLQRTLAAVAGRYDDIERTMLALAARYKVHILAPSGPRRRTGGAFVNTASLVTPAGQIGRQDKLMMTPFERTWGIAPGEMPCVFETALGTLGIAICYDSEFPLLVRAMTVAGAGIIMIPACTERRSGYMRVRAAAAARALEGTVACVLSPTVGDALWSPAVDHNSGAAGVFVPPEAGLSDTGVLAEGVLDTPGWVAATIDRRALQRPLDTGEMRNRADWALQPGAASLILRCEIVDLMSPRP